MVRYSITGTGTSKNPRIPTGTAPANAIITRHIDFVRLTQVIDELLPKGDAAKGGCPPYPTEVMVRILILKHLYNLGDEQMEYQLLDRISYQRFCLLTDSANVPDHNTIWHHQQRLGVDCVTARFQAVDSLLLRHGCMARCGQIIDATLVSALIQHCRFLDDGVIAFYKACLSKSEVRLQGART